MQRSSGTTTILKNKKIKNNAKELSQKNQVLLHLTNRILSCFLANSMT